MKALKIIGIIVLILILSIAVLAFVAPTDFKLERSIEINAQKELVHKHLLYFENSQKWSPWAELDPNQKRGWKVKTEQLALLSLGRK